MLAQVSDPIIMVAKQAGDVRIHTFVSSFAYGNIANATHIIETKNQLVLVDGQFLVPYARAFRSYADSLGKPIERLYLLTGTLTTGSVWGPRSATSRSTRCRKP